MTNNIVAHFSSGLSSDGKFIDYNVVSGSVFNEEYNETLDSATIVLSQVTKEKRLTFIKPYEFVRVFDKSGNTNFNKIYLVDNFDEKENNIKDHLFGYTINLMSETKLLEKIQCPNRVITHGLDENGNVVKLTIYEHIRRSMELYIPKIKFAVKTTEVENDWNYESLIVCPGQFEEDGVTETEFYKRFNVLSADLPFNCPTLRQLLTTLMQQVGCIPVVRNRVLGFLDFQKEAVPFAVNGDYSLDNTVNFIRRTLSSDSYVNTLANLSSQVLDSENEVICETLGFRDSNNVLLKQKENLKLETSLPIYKINKCILHGPIKISAGGYLSSSLGCFYVNPEQYTGEYCLGYKDSLDIVHPYEWPVIFYQETSISSGDANIRFRVSPYLSTFSFTVKWKKICFWKLDATTKKYIYCGLKESADIELDSLLMSSSSLNYYDLSENQSRTFTSKYKDVSFSDFDSSATAFFLSGVFVNNNTGEEKPFTFIHFDDNDEGVEAHDCYGAKEAAGGVAASRQWVEQQYLGTISPTHNPCALTRASSFIYRHSLDDLIGFDGWDITKLIVEESARNFLDRDFEKMISEISSASNATIEGLSKYVYGTVGYSIGSKEISGFSDVFSEGTGSPLGWIERDHTYFENIVNVIQKSGNVYETLTTLNEYFERITEAYQKKVSIADFLSTYGDITHNDTVGAFCCVNTERNNPNLVPLYDEKLTNGNICGFSIKFYNALTNSFDDDIKFYTTFFFDLYYQPLNSFNMSYVKSEEEVPIPLVQYDSGDSGLSDFDRLSIHEQEQVDRIGNETLSISQRTTDFSKIRDFSEGPLYFRDDSNRDGIYDNRDNGVDYIIFKRSFTINNNCFNVSYIGSKDSILKDYFTSIRTKYRAYQYVDFNNSVLRKEKDLLYIRIASDYYDGDDKIRLGPILQYNYMARPYLSNFIYDINNDSDELGYTRNISYEVEVDDGLIYGGANGNIVSQQTIRNSVSVVSTNNFVAFIYEYMDNVGAGTYLNLFNYQTNQPVLIDDVNLGGIPQSWQIWDGNYDIKHTVIFVNKIDFYENTTYRNAPNPEQDVALRVAKIEQTPIVDGFSYTTIFSVVDSNRRDGMVASSDDYQRTFYKDYAERINHTVQFIYYAPNKDVLFGEDFIAGAPVVNRYKNKLNRIIVSDDFSFNPYPHAERGMVYTNINSRIQLITDGENGIPKLRVFWVNNLTVVKLCNYNPVTDEYINIAVFKKQSGAGAYTDYYFTINDTKTDKVFTEEEGILYLRYEVVKYTDSSEQNILRKCLDIFN